MRKHGSGPPSPIRPENFPEQPIVFKGEIVAITKVNTDAMVVKISINNLYIELNCGQDSVLFGRLCKMFDISKTLKITVE